MKYLLLAPLAFLAAGPAIRFEGEGLRIGAALIEGEALELRSDGSAAFLASASTIEPLAASLALELAPGRQFLLEPGLRVAREKEGFRCSSHGNRKIRFASEGESILASSPVHVTATAEGWTIGDRQLLGTELRAGLQAQDDVDSNLERMKAPAEKLREVAIPKLSERRVRVFSWISPLFGGEAAQSRAVRTIFRVSPSGAP